MFFSIKIPNGMSIEVAKYKVLRIARQSIVFYNLSPGELQLDNYLRQKYNIGLKQACYKLIQESKRVATQDSIIIKFKDEDSDKLARIITYGNGIIKGSLILKNLFNRKEK